MSLPPAPAERPAPEAMPPEAADRGVYYRPEDSPGLIARLLIALIDWLVVTAAVAGLVMLARGTSVGAAMRPAAWAGLVLGAAWAYLVALKRTAMGTLGYLLFGARVVDLRGRRPGLFRLTLRLLVSLGFNPLVDLVWVCSDADRQGLRDKVTGTYVVRRAAKPAGTGPLVYSNLFFLSLSLVYREVRRDGPT